MSPREESDGAGAAAPRAAASIILLRDRPGADPPELLLLRRHGRAGFAADAWVFPGGVVDDADRDLPPDCWEGIDPTALADRFRATPRDVLGFHVAAVRETFEEAGLLLARGADGHPATGDDPRARTLRDRLNTRAAGADAFATWVRESGLTLDLGALTYFSRWVTPRAEPRRYDTAFFLAVPPRGQEPEHDRTETTDQRWSSAAAALAQHHAGELHLIYPTIRTLEALAEDSDAGTIAARAAAQHEVRSILPHVEFRADGGWRILHPDDPAYPSDPGPTEVRGVVS